MKKDQLKSLIGNTIFSVLFTKKNGEKRTMLCRLNVKKHLKGGSKLYDQDNLMTVFDLVKKEYRTVNLDTLEVVKFRGNTLKVGK
jgi:hypothetical protein